MHSYPPGGSLHLICRRWLVPNKRISVTRDRSGKGVRTKYRNVDAEFDLNEIGSVTFTFAISHSASRLCVELEVIFEVTIA